MKTILSIRYYDRKSGNMMKEPIYAAKFLCWSYNTRAGRLFTDFFFRHKFVSQFYGRLHQQSWSKRRIKAFADATGVNLKDCLRPLDSFTSFNDFFTREIDLSRRPIDPEPKVCTSPADGKVLAFPIIDGKRSFRIKRSIFNLRQFLDNDALAEKYEGGSLIIIRLHLSDYHHFHFPDSGVPGDSVPIPGKLYAVSPYSLRRLVPFYTENYRMLTLLASDHFGLIAMAEIGAFTVGSIRQLYQRRVRVAKGAKKGFFELGGSTVALLFEPGAIRLDEDLCARTAADLETYVRLGESIGRA
ncbi:MAG: phosphatidylserine decarboxylase [Deltaproteobacteria bacterium]|nr:phosphatidylserine decarboxylase [Deltaproteobacteria bacterium]